MKSRSPRAKKITKKSQRRAISKIRLSGKKQVKSAERLSRVKVRKVKKVATLSADNRDLNTVKRALSELRRIGLYKSKRDLRRVKKSDKRALEKVLKFKDVLTGKSKLSKASSPSKAKKYENKINKVSGKFIVSTPEPEEKQVIRGNKFLEIKKARDGNLYTLAIPSSGKDIDKILKEIDKDKRIQEKLKDGWNLGFRYFGHFSIRFFADTKKIRKYLERYIALEQNIDRFDALEFVMTKPDFVRPVYKDNVPIVKLRVDKTGRTIFKWQRKRTKRSR